MCKPRMCMIAITIHSVLVYIYFLDDLVTIRQYCVSLVKRYCYDKRWQWFHPSIPLQGVLCWFSYTHARTHKKYTLLQSCTYIPDEKNVCIHVRKQKRKHEYSTCTKYMSTFHYASIIISECNSLHVRFSGALDTTWRFVTMIASLAMMSLRTN